jgi:hypothetical protein
MAQTSYKLEPQGKEIGRINLDPEVYKDLEAIAEREGRSVRSQAEFFVEWCVGAEKRYSELRLFSTDHPVLPEDEAPYVAPPQERPVPGEGWSRSDKRLERLDHIQAPKSLMNQFRTICRNHHRSVTQEIVLLIAWVTDRWLANPDFLWDRIGKYGPILYVDMLNGTSVPIYDLSEHSKAIVEKAVESHNRMVAARDAGEEVPL